MKIDFTQPITDLDGKPLDGGTLRTVAIEALLGVLHGDESMTGEQKAQNFALALRIQSEDSPDLTVEQIAAVKHRIGLAYPPLVVGRAWAFLDPVS